MKTLLVLALLLVLLSAHDGTFDSALKHLLSQKAALTKSSIGGGEERPVLKAHGTGITDGQETNVLNYIDQALQSMS